jgi:peptide/nickel transport system substrate-binding protein
MASEYWNKWWTAKSNRRRFLGAGATAGLGAAGLALVGCGDDDDDTGGDTPTTAAGETATSAPGETPTSAPTTAGIRGGTLRYPLEGMSSGDPPTLFPYENLTYLAQHPASLHYSRLLMETAGPGIESSDYTALAGDLAEGLPEQPDPQTYIFKIRPNIKFHNKAPLDGRAVTAKDIADSYEAFISISQNAAAYEAVVESLEATDDSTITVKTKVPYAPFLVTHASSVEGFWYIPVETINNGQVQTDPVGTGPWVFKNWETGVAMRWDRNPDFYEADIPWFDSIEASLLKDPQRLITGLQAGEFDMAGLSGSVYNDAHGKVDPAGIENFSPTGVLGAFYFNFDNDGGRWRDKRLRQALSMALNRDEVVKVLDQTGKGVWQSHLSPALAPYYLDPKSSDFGENAKYFEFNPAEAKALIQAATGSDTVTLKMTGNVDRYGAGAQQAWELFASLLGQNGFNIELVFQEYGSYIQSTYLGDMTEGIGVGPLIGSPRDPNDIFSRNFESSSARNNWGGTAIDEMADIDADFAAQREIFDVEERVAFIRDIQRKMAESMLVVPYHGGSGYGYVQPWVQNYHDKIGYAVHRASITPAWFTQERIDRG